MSNCEAYWELISAAVDGALTDEERRRLETHLAGCPACKTVYDQMTGMTDGLGELESPPLDFADAVMAAAARTEQEIPFTALDDRRDIHAQGRAQLKAWWQPIRRAMALVACCLIVVGVWRVTQWTTGSSGVAQENSAAADVELAGSATCSDAEGAAEDCFSQESASTAAVPTLEVDGRTYFSSGAVADSVPEGYAQAGALPDGRVYYAGADGEGIYVAEETGYSYWIEE